MTANNSSLHLLILNELRSITSNSLELSRSHKFPEGVVIPTHSINLKSSDNILSASHTFLKCSEKSAIFS